MSTNFEFRNLTNEIRILMREEINLDVEQDVLYKSVHFTLTGQNNYLNLLEMAVEQYNEQWLAEQLSGYFMQFDENNHKVPYNANIRFAQSEFNRFYIRAICRYSINNNLKTKVYRAKYSENPKPESQAKIGLIVNPKVILNDLRTRIGTNTQFGISDVGSGLSLEIVS